jgi:hypothetical protein
MKTHISSSCMCAAQQRTYSFDAYQVIRSRRRTIALVVEPDGRVIVRAPARLPDAAIRSFVAEHSEWIRQKQAEQEQRRERCGRPAGAPRQFIPDEMFSYLGQAYPLRVVERQPAALVFKDGFSLRQDALPQAAALFEAWYRKRARAVLAARLAELAAQHGFRYGQMRLSSARTRWGSCSSSGTISLNWKLVMAPPEIIDYVILHELAHTQERNHSARFWALVARLDPEYKARRRWLKENGACLGWP